MERIIRQLAAEDIHGIADDDVTGMDGFAANLGGSEDFGLGEVLAKLGEKGKQSGGLRLVHGVNTCVHRDYMSTGSVQVMLFKDRLEVWNPGRLPKGMTVEKLAGEHASLPVNPLLANPVYLAGYIEQVGTGKNDVINRCVELGLRKPELTFVFLLRSSVKRASSMTLGLASVPSG